MKRMLFNATQPEELRVAIVDGQKLIDIDIEVMGREQRKANIYKGIITRIEPSLEACFVNYGEERHGFLPFKEITRSYFRDGVNPRNTSIKEAIREGQEILLQIEKEERGNKGAALTSFISLAGRYLVLMPNNPRSGGISRRIEGEERQELRDQLDRLTVPQGMSVIARTAGIGRSFEELQWDLNYLLQLWNAIEGASKSAEGAFLIYQESSLVIRAIRDYFHPEIGEILVDTDDLYEQAQQFMSHVMPDMVSRVKRYRDDVPLFSRFQIEQQIETAYSRIVPLPSGGALVVDHTEALVAIDVNSARSTRASDIEATAFQTNYEAAEEIARQLRLRDLGGLVVIDFIDMENPNNQRDIENHLKDVLHHDRARIQLGKISRFGLMELSRQRLRPSLSEGSHQTCPRCNGTGHIRDSESSALHILRLLQEEAMKENTANIYIQVPLDVAAFLLNEKRGEILKIETRHRITIVVIPNKFIETPHFKLDRAKHDDKQQELSSSLDIIETITTNHASAHNIKIDDQKPRQEAIVKGIVPAQPAPQVESNADKKKTPLLSKVMSFFFGKEEEPEQLKEEASSKVQHSNRNHKTRGRRPQKREQTSALEVSDESLQTQHKSPRNPRGRGFKQNAEKAAHTEQPDNLAEVALQENFAFVKNQEPMKAEQEESELGEEARSKRYRQRGRGRNRYPENEIAAITSTPVEPSANASTTELAAASEGHDASHQIVKSVVRDTLVSNVEKSHSVSAEVKVEPLNAHVEITPPIRFVELPKATENPMPVSELQNMLGSADLQMVLTDPVKYQHVQAEAAKVVSPPHIPRERKPLPPLVTENLVQVETKLADTRESVQVTH